MGEVREAALVVRLSAAERASWHAAARAAGWGKTAGWVRSVVAAAVAGRGGSTSAAAASSTSSAPATAGTPAAVDREVLRELSQIGSNVNQLARAVNVAARGGQRLEVEAAAVEALRVEVVRLTAAVTAAATSSRTPSSTSSSTASSAGDGR
ncbi:plasmid mobilization relaxosome protein MobC [Kineococcus sp. SYSU DK018]|uniref:plasmid mobilization relaxosome protein MobC n=1 Tax=Kineococcus sp. SYSU DK018 TaxID=3383139 RepID=UPI003D7C4A15